MLWNTFTCVSHDNAVEWSPDDLISNAACLHMQEPAPVYAWKLLSADSLLWKKYRQHSTMLGRNHVHISNMRIVWRRLHLAYVPVYTCIWDDAQVCVQSQKGIQHTNKAINSCSRIIHCVRCTNWSWHHFTVIDQIHTSYSPALDSSYHIVAGVWHVPKHRPQTSWWRCVCFYVMNIDAFCSISALVFVRTRIYELCIAPISAQHERPKIHSYIHRDICTDTDNLETYINNKGYRTMIDGQQVYIHPSSVLLGAYERMWLGW